MTDEELVKHARTMSGMLIMGEPVAFGSDAGLIDALADAIERLTRERDDCRKDWLLQSKISNGYAEALIAAEKERDVAKAKIEKLREALAQPVNAAPSEFDLKVMAERDAAKQKVEKLRAALRPFAEMSERISDDFPDGDGIIVSARSCRRACAALKETSDE